MKHINLIVINGEAKEMASLPKKEREVIVNELNRRALKCLGYQEIKTA